MDCSGSLQNVEFSVVPSRNDLIILPGRQGTSAVFLPGSPWLAHRMLHGQSCPHESPARLWWGVGQSCPHNPPMCFVYMWNKRRKGRVGRLGLEFGGEGWLVTLGFQGQASEGAVCVRSLFVRFRLAGG